MGMNLTKEGNKPFLIIGYGNDLRGDDAAGQIVARMVQSRNNPNIMTIDIHQLTPELAYDLSMVDYAVFIDACEYSEQDSVVKITEIGPEDVDIVTTGHFGSPQGTLQLSKSIYGSCPKSWLIAIPGINFEFSEELSDISQKGVEEALKMIEKIIAYKDSES
jgi:hydrogenase maturation protease